jgi:hypothetical protein
MSRRDRVYFDDRVLARPDWLRLALGIGLALSVIAAAWLSGGLK